MVTTYKVTIHNPGKSARVIHDKERPVRIPAGETVEETLRDDTIKRLKEEHGAGPDDPALELKQGEQVAEFEDAPPPGAAPGGSQHVASGHDEGPHKKRGPPQA